MASSWCRGHGINARQDGDGIATRNPSWANLVRSNSGLDRFKDGLGVVG